MRNTAVYPITEEEKISALENILKEHIRSNEGHMVCGDITALAAQEGIRDLQKYYELANTEIKKLVVE